MRLPQLILLLTVACLIGVAHSLPPALQLGGAIVAAVEQDAAQEQATAATTEQQLHNNQLLDNLEGEARGKLHKQKKLLKMLYPVLGAALLAKFILLPLILKWLTALSASSFVMAKIALAAAGLLALKSSPSAHDRLSIVHAPSPALKSYHGDLSSSGSSWMPLRPQPYIPLGVAKDGTYRLADGKDLYKPFL